MKTLRAPILLGIAALCATATHAAGVRSEKNLSLEIATQIAAGAVADCQARGYAVAATVVDRASSVRAEMTETVAAASLRVRIVASRSAAAWRFAAATWCAICLSCAPMRLTNS